MGSLIITTDDYRKSKSALSQGLIGARLKTILSDKTVIYVGYSYNDEDLSYINQFVSKQLGKLGKQAYIVTLDDSEESKSRYAKNSVIPIYTDAQYFLSTVKEHAYGTHCFIRDEIYPICATFLRLVESEHKWLHKKYRITEKPQIVYSAFYQDGLQHALERVVTLRGTGQYSDRHRVIQKVRGYCDLAKTAIRRRRYTDLAYIEGYISGLIFVIEATAELEDFDLPGLYYGMGVGILKNRRAFRDCVDEMPRLHKAGMHCAERVADRVRRLGGDVEMHHKPELGGLD